MAAGAPGSPPEPVRGRATFAALARARRLRSGPVGLRFLPGGTSPRVSYAPAGGLRRAVDRNRVRRRLRHAVAQCAASLGPGAYLFHAGPEALTVDFGELVRSVRSLVIRAGTSS